MLQTDRQFECCFTCLISQLRHPQGKFDHTRNSEMQRWKPGDTQSNHGGEVQGFVYYHLLFIIYHGGEVQGEFACYDTAPDKQFSLNM